jgi:hypothetical protein
MRSSSTDLGGEDDTNDLSLAVQPLPSFSPIIDSTGLVAFAIEMELGEAYGTQR